MGRFDRARTLVKSRQYPTFQFYAVAASRQISAEKQLILSVLTTLEWLRAKFSEFNIPDEINMPSPEMYAEVPLENLKSVHIDEGYTVDIVSLPAQRIWSLRLSEPDLSTKIIDGVEHSAAVPGRIFQTEVAFCVVNSVLQCGFRVIVSEPEMLCEPCRVYRPAIIQALAEEPLIGLQCGYPISDSVLLLNTPDRIKQLRDYLRHGNLPVVVLCDIELKQKLPDMRQFTQSCRTQKTEIQSLLMNSQKAFMNDMINGYPPAQDKRELPAKANERPYDTEELIKKRACYAHFFRCCKSSFEGLKRVLHIEAHDGDIFLLRPARFGGEIRVFPKTESPVTNMEKVAQCLLSFPDELFDYGNVTFHSEAVVKQIEELSRTRSMKADIIKMQLDEISVLKKQIDELKHDQRISAERYAERVQTTVKEANEKIRIVQEDADKRVKQAEQERDRCYSRIAHFEGLARRPKQPGDIPEWVEKSFAGRMIFHQKAVRLISGTSPDEVNMPILCDALEYLATEYRDRRMGKIDSDEAIRLSSEKYGRTFIVTLVGEETAKYSPKDYKIKYKIGKAGKPVETLLDLHLKLGNTSDNLLRIYFLYDDEKDLVVVGSLPKHLKTKTYS